MTLALSLFCRLQGTGSCNGEKKKQLSHFSLNLRGVNKLIKSSGVGQRQSIEEDVQEIYRGTLSLKISNEINRQKLKGLECELGLFSGFMSQLSWWIVPLSTTPNGKLLVWYSSTLLPSSFKPFRLSCSSQTRLPETHRDLKWEHWLRLSSVDQRMKGWWSQSGFGLNDSCWVSKFPRAVFVIIVFVMNVTSSLKRCVN